MEPESMVTLAVYFMSIASFIPLFEVSVPFDGYRTIVYIGSFVATTLMFIFTYVSGFNVLGLNLSVDYRTILPNVGMMIGAFLFVWLLVYLTPRIIKKIKEKKHD
jgi:hypothetical protein